MRGSLVLALAVAALATNALEPHESVKELGVDEVGEVGETTSPDNELAQLKAAQAAAAAEVEKLESQDSAIQAKVESMQKTDTGSAEEQEQAAAARKQVEEEVAGMKNKLKLTQRNVNEHLKHMQDRVKAEVQARDDKLKAHDADMAEEEKALETKIKDLDSESAQKDDQMSKALQRIAANKEQVKGIDAEASKLEKLAKTGKAVGEQIVAKAKSRAKAADDQLKAEKSKLAATKAAMAQMASNYTHLAALPDEMREKSKKMHREVLRARERMTRTSGRLADAKSDEEAAKSELSVLKEKKDALLAEKRKSENEMRETKDSNWIRMQKIRKLKADVATAQAEVDSKAAQANEMYGEAQTLTVKGEDAKKRVDATDASIQKWHKVGQLAAASVEKMNAMETKVNAKTHALEADAVRLGARTDEIQEEYDLTKRKLESRLRDLRGANELKANEDATFASEQHALEKQVTQSKEVAKAAEIKSEDIDKKVASLKPQLEFLNEEKEAQAEKAESDQRAFKAQQDKLESELLEAKAHIRAIKEQDEDAQEELTKTTRAHDTVQKTITAAHDKKMHDIENEMKKAKAEHVDAEKESALIIQTASAKQKKVIALGRHAQHVLEKKETQLSKKLARQKKAIADAIAKDGDEVHQHEAEVNTLKDKADKVSSQESNLESNIDSLTKQKSSLKLELSHVQDKAAESLKWKQMEAHEVVKQKEAKLEIAKLESEKHEHVIALLNSKRHDAEESEAATTKSLDNIEKRKASLQDAVDEKGPTLRKEQDDLKAANAAGKKLSDEQNNFDAAIADQQNALLREGDAVNKASASERNEQGELSTKEAAAVQVAADLGKVEAQVDHLDAQSKTKQGKIVAARAQNGELNSQVSTADKQLKLDADKLEGEKDAMAAARNASSAYDAEVEKEKARMDVDTSKVQSLEKKLTLAEDEINAENAKIDKEGSKVDNLEYDAENADGEEKELTAEQKALKEKIAKMMAKLKSEGDAGGAITAELAKLMAEFRASKAAALSGEAEGQREEAMLAADAMVKKHIQGEYESTMARINRMRSRIAFTKQKISDDDDDYKSAKQALATATDEFNQKKAEEDAALQAKTSDLQKSTTKLNELQGLQPGLESDVSDLKAKKDSEEAQLESAKSADETAKDKKLALDSEVESTSRMLKQRQDSESANAALVQTDVHKLLLAQQIEESLKSELLKLQMSTQEQTGELTESKRAVAAEDHEVENAKQAVESTKRKINDAETATDNDKIQSESAEGRAQSASNSAQLAALKKQIQAAADKAKAEAEKIAAENKAADEAEQQAAALSGKLVGVNARLQHVTSEITSAKDQIMDVKHDINFQEKKQQVLGKVQQSWTQSLTEGKEKHQNIVAQQQRTETAIHQMKTDHGVAVQKEERTLASVQKKTEQWKMALKNTTDSYAVAHGHNANVKAQQAQLETRMQMVDAQMLHATKRLNELRERKRVLVQSKLEDLEKQTAPFHSEAVEAMDKMAHANQLRAEAMKKTEAMVNSTSMDAEPSEADFPAEGAAAASP
jgi:chromosome segregation ATPase